MEYKLPQSTVDFFRIASERKNGAHLILYTNSAIEIDILDYTLGYLATFPNEESCNMFIYWPNTYSHGHYSSHATFRANAKENLYAIFSNNKVDRVIINSTDRFESPKIEKEYLPYVLAASLGIPVTLSYESNSIADFLISLKNSGIDSPTLCLTQNIRAITMVDYRSDEIDYQVGGIPDIIHGNNLRNLYFESVHLDPNLIELLLSCESTAEVNSILTKIINRQGHITIKQQIASLREEIAATEEVDIPFKE